MKRLLAVITLCAATALAQDPEEAPARLEGMEPWGKLTRAMAPSFPKALLDSKVSGHVDIVGKLNVVGMLQDVEYTAGSPEAQALVGPLKGVMEFWRFRVPVDDNCQPVPAHIRNRIWIDLSGEQPSMRIGVLKEPVERQPREIKTLHREQPRYPRSMARMAWQSLVYAAVDVDPAGNVISVSSTAYPKKRGVDLVPFEDEVNEALRKWKFTPAEEGRTKKRRVCYDILFRLND